MNLRQLSHIKIKMKELVPVQLPMHQGLVWGTEQGGVTLIEPYHKATAIKMVDPLCYWKYILLLILRY